jgi:hypothetical protein
MESRRNAIFPGNGISATYLFKNKLKDLQSPHSSYASLGRLLRKLYSMGKHKDIAFCIDIDFSLVHYPHDKPSEP